MGDAWQGSEVNGLGAGPSPDRMASSFPWCPGLSKPDPCLILPGGKKFPLREKASPSQSSFFIREEAEFLKT